jgi:hypothetical protein
MSSTALHERPVHDVYIRFEADGEVVYATEQAPGRIDHRGSQ